MLNCYLCNTRIAVFNCTITNQQICNYCCDKFQLNQQTKGWDKFFQGKVLNINYIDVEIQKLHENCLNCHGLCRIEGYEVHTRPENGFGFSLFTFSHKGKFVFTNNMNQLHTKRKVLLENYECSTREDYFYLAETYYFLGEYQKSIRLLSGVVKDFDDAELYLLLGNSFRFSGDKKLALRNMRKAWSLCETNPRISRHLGDLLRSMNDYEGSIFYHKESLKYYDIDDEGQPNDSFHEYNYFGLATSYYKLNQYDKAIEVANKFFDMNLGWDHLKERIQQVRNGEVTDFNINSDIYLFSTLYEILSISYLEKDDLENAEEYITRAKWLHPNDTDIAKIEGIIIGRRFNRQELLEYKMLLANFIENAEDKLFAPLHRLEHSIEEIKKGSKEPKVNMLELKPNFMGIGVNFNEVLKRLTNKDDK